jgi:hypothetical protein
VKSSFERVLYLSDKKEKCLKCGDTGTMVDGKDCDCRAKGKINMPIVLDVPAVYQTAEFAASLVPIKMPRNYGIELEDIIDVIKSKGRFTHNLLICSPPNTGKTVFSYTVFRHQYVKGLPMSEIMDLIEARELLMSNSYDEYTIKAKDKLITCPLAIIKIPLDLPNKFAETICTITERRVRKNGVTIFLYGGSIFDLQNQDRFGVLKNIIRDGSYNSLKVISHQYMDSKEE